MTFLTKSAACALIAAFALLAVSMLGVPSSSRAAADSDQLTMYVFSGGEKIVGPDGKPHDTVVPANFVVHAGQAFTITVINYDESPHSITSPDAKVNFTMKAGVMGKGGKITPTTSTFTFTPTTKGVYRWYCVYPCDKGHGMWAMGQGYGGPGKEGFMAGYIIVI
jgi:plastocyanin